MFSSKTIFKYLSNFLFCFCCFLPNSCCIVLRPKTFEKHFGFGIQALRSIDKICVLFLHFIVAQRMQNLLFFIYLFYFFVFSSCGWMENKTNSRTKLNLVDYTQTAKLVQEKKTAINELKKNLLTFYTLNIIITLWAVDIFL